MQLRDDWQAAFAERIEFMRSVDEAYTAAGMEKLYFSLLREPATPDERLAWQQLCARMRAKTDAANQVWWTNAPIEYDWSYCADMGLAYDHPEYGPGRLVVVRPPRLGRFVSVQLDRYASGMYCSDGPIKRADWMAVWDGA